MRKVWIAANWEDVAFNLQTKALAKKLSETCDVLYFSQGRVGSSPLKVNDHLTVVQWPTRRVKSFSDLIFILKKIIRHKPDVFIAHYDATIICMIVSWLMRVKYRIGWIHTLKEQYALDGSDEKEVKRIFSRRKKIYRLATHVVVMTDYSRRDVMQHFGIPERKIIKIHNGVYPLSPSTSPNGKITIRYVGRVIPSKGVDVLLQAFKNICLNNEQAILEIVGRGEDLEKLKSFVDKEKLNDKVFFHGYWANYERVRQFIAEAYCLVVPSRVDNFPTVILEAFSSSVPVIASNTGGIPEMMTNEREGYLVNNEDVEGFADMLEKMINNGDLRNKMGLRAKCSYEEKFCMEKHVERVMEFLEGLK